jgi:Carboxypeptidase regulatory-like domain
MKSALLATLLLLASQQAIAPRGTGSIEGVVVVAGSSRPMANASVFLSGPPSNLPDSPIRTVTDANGKFAFHDVPAPFDRYYRINADVPEYDRAMQETPYKAGEVLTNVVVTVMTRGTIRGRIVGANGTPVPRVPVFVYQEWNNWTDPPRALKPFEVAADGSGRLIGFDGLGTDANLGQATAGGGGNIGTFGVMRRPTPVETDSQGNYVLKRIPPGRYLIGVEFPFGYAPNPNGFATTFYPGVTDSTKARAVVIEPEVDVRNVDFKIQKADRFTVSGTLQLGGAKASGVSLHPVGEPNMAPTFWGSVNPEGRFEIHNVLAGSYELSVNDGAIPVRVPVRVQGNVTGITTQLPAMSTIEGTLRIMLRPGDAKLPGEVRLAVSKAVGSPTRITEAGPFRMDAMAAGEHYLFLQLAGAGYVLDVHQGPHNVADDNIVRVGNGAAPLTLLARPADYGTVTGQVHTNIGKTQLSEVLLAPDGPRRSNPFQHYSVRTKFDGTFKFDNVVPGSYKLFAWEWGRALGLNPYMKVEALVPFEKYGVPLEVRPNESASVSVSPIPH